ncbi:hypothetical protein CFOL_v3_13502 [Cephalotus follicularis]|uniref:CCHC-type domain-containing protein n=1 Tax=Cephalotus follicularis TaxID=3775 RepID=A0A1Q3BQM7_CEPFO|nr:hypothetical protein CFOL_v3_13502 [Cephalotus follicularis]
MPPLFDGNDYSQWKIKKSTFIQSLDYDLWDMIVFGLELPKEYISKPRIRYNEKEKEMLKLNAKAKHIIFCALSSNEFDCISSCESAKEIWDKLENLHEEKNVEGVTSCLMAMEEDSSGDESENEVNFTFEELQNAYENLFKEYENVSLKNKSLKKSAISMSKEIDDLKSENSKFLNKIESLKDKNSFYVNEIDILNVSSKLSIDFMEENEKLKIEIDALKKSFSIFSNSSAKLDNLLGLQRCVFDKAGLGYEQMKNVKHFKNFFVKNEPKFVCNYCGKLGHISTSCFYRNNLCIGKTRKIWIPKGMLMTNLQGPKFKWVPKA